MKFTRAHLNPFRVSRLEALRFRFPPGENWESLETRLAHHGGRGAVIGPRGSGKTTLLEEWAQRRRKSGKRILKIRLNTERRIISSAYIQAVRRDPQAEVFLDGAEQLSFRAWRRFLSDIGKARVLIITSHRAGRLPLLLRTGMTPMLARDIVKELLEGEETPSIAALLPDLLRQHEGNLREVLLELYDRTAAGSLP